MSVSKLRILITNNTLAERAGSELYVYDLAKALLSKGHTPIVYSTALGDVAQELRQATVPVVNDLSTLAIPPDLIHGQHHLDTMTALLHFPGVPCIYFCHGWLPWEEAPPRFPRIHQYVAVSDACRDRLLYEHGIASDQIEVLLNFVDLDRFQLRSKPLPLKPQRAVVFSNAASQPDHLHAVREACDRLGIALDAVGLGAGAACTQPEQMLERYDLVFAKGRSALEAMAVGAAVIVHDTSRMGEIVTTENFARFRRLNFGIRIMQNPIEVERLVSEMSRYDPIDAAQVSHAIRATGGRDAVIEQIIQLYEKILQQEAGHAKPGAVAESRAVSAYLHWLSPRMKQLYQCELKLTQRQEQAKQDEEQLAHLHLASEQRQQALILTQQHCRNLEAALEQARSQLEQSHHQWQVELRTLQAHLDWMETSKFWKLRQFYLWFKQQVMQALRLPLTLTRPAKMR